MALNQTLITQKEVQVCNQIKDLLLELGIGFTTTERPDLVIVTEPETNIPISLDAEETVACLRVQVCRAREDEQFYQKLLQANAQIAHGHFQIEHGQVILADNLETENLDANELEASIASLVTALVRNADWLE